MTREQIVNRLLEAITVLDEPYHREAIATTIREAAAALATPVAAEPPSLVALEKERDHYREHCGRMLRNRYDMTNQELRRDRDALVALVQEWQAAIRLVRALNDDGGGPSADAFSEACDRYDHAVAALLAWTPAEPSMEQAKASILAAQAHGWSPPDNAPGTTPETS